MSSHQAFVRSTAGAASLLAILKGAPAAAQPSAPAEDAGVRIESSTCRHALVDDVQHLARVELNGAGLPEGTDAPRVVLSCSGRTVLLRAVLGNEGDSRQLDLDTTDDGLRARVIALASAELVRDTAGRAARPQPAAAEGAPAPSRPSSAPHAAPPVAHPVSSNRLAAFGKLSNFGSSFEPLYGGGIEFSRDLGRFAFGLGPELLASQRATALGSVDLLAADLSLRVALRFRSRSAPGEVGLGHALGLARIEGKAASPNADSGRVSGTWASPFVFAQFEPRLWEPLFLLVSVQFGVVTVPVRGQVARAADVGFAGVWGGLSLGCGLGL